MAGCSRGVGQGCRCSRENSRGLPCCTGPALQSPSRAEGHLQGLWNKQKDGEIEQEMEGCVREPTMSDVPMTRQPVPRPRWNDYQVVQRATMNHPSSILQNAPSLSQRVSQSVSQAGRKEADSHRFGQHLLQTAGENGSCAKHKAPSKLVLSEKFRWQIYLSYSLFSSINWHMASNVRYSLGL